MPPLPPLNLNLDMAARSDPFTQYSTGVVNFGGTSTGMTGASITPLMALLILAAVLVFKRVL